MTSPFNNNPYPPALISPTQAANTFSQAGSLPRQRNQFIARFVVGQPQGAINTQSQLTVALKMIERPKVNYKVEELNEYNKKRQILTGFKLDPLRMQFYDSKDGAAQAMWQSYSSYYYGDFQPQLAIGQPASMSSYQYDATLNTFYDLKQTGFGFTAANGGGAGASNPGNQFYFDRIEIYHFYDEQYFDLYYLIHPRIVTFEADDVDYENSAIAMINIQIAYELLQYFSQQQVANSPVTFSEFAAPSPFYTQTVATPSPVIPPSNTPTSTLTASNPSVNSFFSGLPGLINSVADYRFASAAATGPLASYGSFQFGPNSAAAGSTSLTNMAIGNPALTAAFNGTQSSSAGSLNILSSQIAAATSGFGTAGNTVTQGALASQAAGSGFGLSNSGGFINLSPSTLGMINAQQTGTAQYGFDDGTG